MRKTTRSVTGQVFDTPPTPEMMTRKITVTGTLNGSTYRLLTESPKTMHRVICRPNVSGEEITDGCVKAILRMTRNLTSLVLKNCLSLTSDSISIKKHKNQLKKQ